MTHNNLLDAINKSIDAFNQEVRTEHNKILGGHGKNLVVPGMDMWGIRRNSRKKMEHVLNHFREQDEGNMLHLVPKKQARAAGRVIKFVKLCTPNPLASQPSPPTSEIISAETVTSEEAAAGPNIEPSEGVMANNSADPTAEPTVEPGLGQVEEPSLGQVEAPSGVTAEVTAEENPAMAVDQDEGSDTEADMEPINDDLLDEPDD